MISEIHEFHHSYVKTNTHEGEKSQFELLPSNYMLLQKLLQDRILLDDSMLPCPDRAG